MARVIGSWAEKHRLKCSYQPEFVHFLGFKADIRDYFSASDLGFLPTRFCVESGPPVLIDCLLAGRPMLAAEVGEIPHMLSTDTGYARIVFELEDWTINVPGLAQLIAGLAEHAHSYRELLARAPRSTLKFDFDVMVDKLRLCISRFSPMQLKFFTSMNVGVNHVSEFDSFLKINNGRWFYG